MRASNPPATPIQIELSPALDMAPFLLLFLLSMSHYLFMHMKYARVYISTTLRQHDNDCFDSTSATSNLTISLLKSGRNLISYITRTWYAHCARMMYMMAEMSKQESESTKVGYAS